MSKGVELVRSSEDDPSVGIRDMDSLGEIAHTRPVLSRVIPDGWMVAGRWSLAVVQTVLETMLGMYARPDRQRC